ncbi:MAG: flagellar basal body rod modification protein [Blastopirellula sp.]|nr:MAG: flagellar basal body rod modification protein [Blastopirellula sp.]
MTISETLTQQYSTAAPSTANTPVKATSLTSDFDSFIKMLTAQAKYQDPMDPIDSTEFASQLAQFSMVEQQVKTNEMLAALYGLTGTSNMASLASWVGMEARANTPMYFSGDPIEISSTPYLLADEVFLVVSDENGTEIQRKQIAVSDETVSWLGLSDSGNLIEHGIYNFTIESFKNDALVLAEPAEVYGQIIEAQTLDGEVILVMQGGQSILASSVTALRSVP